MKKPILRLEHISKFYEEGGNRVNILNDVSVEITEGELVVLLGKSGSGKTTLLNLISGIDSPDSGRIEINGKDISGLTESELTLLRRDHIGFIFQFFNLIPTLTVMENVSLPRELSGVSRKDSFDKTLCLLEKVGLENRAESYTDVLSGGEQQRVAIARSLVNDPALILADEPTGNLDTGTSLEVLHLLLGIQRESGKTMIVATHSTDIAERGDTVYNIEKGSLIQVSS
jgi:putative ABC transport system ATP-binding protein